LTWEQRAEMLAGNAIRFLKLESRFGKAFQQRLREFEDLPLKN